MVLIIIVMIIAMITMMTSTKIIMKIHVVKIMVNIRKKKCEWSVILPL